MVARPAPTQPWLYGPLPDLLLGCGLAYALVFALQSLAGATLREWVPMGLAPLLLLVTSTPHFGATVVRVYERREDRRAYTIFAVWLTLAVAALFVAGVHNAWIGSWLVTIMLTWSPWHYTGQNYGVALMFLRRRGVPIRPALKRAIYVSFMISFLLTVLAVHGQISGAQYAPTPYRSTEYRFMPLGIPDAIRMPAFIVLCVAYVASIAAAGVMLLRVASWRALVPTALTAVTQAVWFSVPVLAREYGKLQGIEPFAMQHAAYSFLWIAVGHSIQYLWVTTYFAERREPGFRRHAYLFKTLLAGAALWTVPALLFAPRVLGRPAFDTGLELLITSAVSIHHFILDGAIWKLRDGRVARILVRAESRDASAPIAPQRRWRLAPLVLGVGAACAVLTAWVAIETEFGVRRAAERGDAERVERAIARLDRVGRESTQALVALGTLRAREGRYAEAIQAAGAAIALQPTPDGWRTLGLTYELAAQPAEAIRAYRAALRLRESWPEVENNLAWILATNPNPKIRDPAQAVAHATHAAEQTGGSEAQILDTLAAAYAASRRFQPALQTARRARDRALASGDAVLAHQIAGRMALYAARRPYVEAPQAATPQRQEASAPTGG